MCCSHGQKIMSYNGIRDIRLQHQLPNTVICLHNRLFFPSNLWYRSNFELKQLIHEPVQPTVPGLLNGFRSVTLNSGFINSMQLKWQCTNYIMEMDLPFTTGAWEGERDCFKSLLSAHIVDLWKWPKGKRPSRRAYYNLMFTNKHH